MLSKRTKTIKLIEENIGEKSCENLYGSKTRVIKKWITNKDLLCNRWNSAQCYVAARMGGEFQGE